MSTRKNAVVVIAIALALVFSSLGVTQSYATGDPNQLDQGDFTIQCKQQYGHNGWQAHPYGNTVVDWKCFYNDGLPWSVWTSERKSIDIAGYCWRIWGKSANYHDYYDRDSWYCS